VKNSFLKLLACIGVSLTAGIIGSFFTSSAIPLWYNLLLKPAFNPPSWVFGPVWTILYILMGTAAYMIWQKDLGRKEVRFALWIFAFQLVLNTLWSIIFFGLKSPALALIEIVTLWLSITYMMILFYKISRPASLLIIPYVLWVSFAIYLNYSIWFMN